MWGVLTMSPEGAPLPPTRWYSPHCVLGAVPGRCWRSPFRISSCCMLLNSCTSPSLRQVEVDTRFPQSSASRASTGLQGRLHGLGSYVPNSRCVCFPQAHQCSVSILQSPAPAHGLTLTHRCSQIHIYTMHIGTHPCAHRHKRTPPTERHAHACTHMHTDAPPQSHLHTHAWV